MANEFIDDISALADGELGEVDMPTEDEAYEPARGGARVTPPAGRYNLKLPDEITVGAWPKNEKGPGSIELQMDSVSLIAPGESFDGDTIRFVNVSTRRIGGANASSATDLLMRAGVTPLPRNAAEWQDAARQLQGATVEGVYCDWETRTPKTADAAQVRAFLKTQKIETTDPKAKKVVIRGMKRYPQNEDGTYQSRLVFDQGPGGESLTLYANLRPTMRGFGLTKEEIAERV